MNKYLRSFLISIIFAAVCGIAIGLLCYKFAPKINPLLAGGIVFGFVALFGIMSFSNKSFHKDDKINKSGMGKTKSGDILSQYEDSRWVTAKELKTLKKFKNASFSNLKKIKKDGVVIRSELKGSHLDVNMYGPMHSLVIGTTGSGKTQGYILPSIQILSSCASKPCLVITDPKGELYRDTSRKLYSEGYNVKVLDLRKPYMSTCWNPMYNAYEKYTRAMSIEKELRDYHGSNPADYNFKIISKTYDYDWYEFEGVAYPTRDSAELAIKSRQSELKNIAEEDLKEIAIKLCPVTNKNDRTWEEGAQNFIYGLMYAMLEDTVDPLANMTEDKFNLYNVQKMANLKDDDPDEPYRTLKNYFLGRDEFSKAYELVSTALFNSASTTKNYMGIVSGALNIMSDTGLAYCTSKNEMEFDDFVSQPTALYIKVPDEKTNRHPIATMCIMQLYQKLIEIATATKDLCLPRNVYFLLDEFANLPKIEKFENLITVGRSRKIWFSLVVQSYSQLDGKYTPEIAQVIRENCPIKIFIGTDDQKTKEDFSKLCGDISIELTNVNQQRNYDSANSGTSESISKNTVSRPLITPDQLGHIGAEKAIVKIFNEYPIKSSLSFAYKCHMFENRPMPEEYAQSKYLDEESIKFDVAARNNQKLKQTSANDFWSDFK